MSRTSTAQWKRIRAKRRKHDFDNGLTNCPDCNVWLDWYHSGQPNSAETDHIIAHAQGGADSFDNSRTCCRSCNQRLGGKLGGTKNNTGRFQKQVTGNIDTAINWGI